jgi:thiol:disulfide interchange protein
MMSKGANTVIFIITATVINIIITIAVFILIMGLFSWLIAPHVSPEAVSWAMMVIFIIAVSLSFIIYQAIAKQFTKKVDMEKYFLPIFAPKHRPKRKIE